MKAIKIIGLSALVFFSCSKSENKETTDQDMVLREDEAVSEATKERINWDEVDVTSPIVTYDEVKSKDIEVRASDRYSVYSIDEKILFDVDKATIRSGGEEKLQEVVTSLKQRYPEGEIAVKGYTDATGSKSYNKDLSKERAEAVANFLQQKGDIEEDRIEVIAKGEKNPTATNETAEGRQENRRVEIMVRG